MSKLKRLNFQARDSRLWRDAGIALLHNQLLDAEKQKRSLQLGVIQALDEEIEACCANSGERDDAAVGGCASAGSHAGCGLSRVDEAGGGEIKRGNGRGGGRRETDGGVGGGGGLL